MKLFLFLLMNFYLSSVFSLDSSPICLNKSINVSTYFNEQESTLELSINDQVDDFEIKVVNGVDGLEVIDFRIQENVKNEKYTIDLSLDRPEGQSFLIISVSYNKKNSSAHHKHRDVISVPLGRLNEKQVTERSKRIKFLGNGQNEINGHGKIQMKKLSVHELPLQKK